MATDVSKKNEKEMEYRMLGGTGLKVSVLGFGTMSFNNLEQAQSMMVAARKIGINFFDNAELYGAPLGNAEVLFGKALKNLESENPELWRRSDLVITTKLYFGPSPNLTENVPTNVYGKNESGLSRKHLMEGVDASLKRMQLEYVDIIYAHRHDAATPLLEVIEGFTQIIRDGKAFYWGTSMWPAVRIIEAYWLAKMHKLIPPVVEQPLYSMFNRSYVELEYLPVFNEPYNIGTTVWSPLDGGILTGKYLNEVPKDSRLGSDRLGAWFKPEFDRTIEAKMAKVPHLKKVCERLKCELADLALAWVLKNKNVSVCLLGASRPSQLESNLSSLVVARKLDKETMEELDKILANKPVRDGRIWADNGRVEKKTIETF